MMQNQLNKLSFTESNQNVTSQTYGNSEIGRSDNSQIMERKDFQTLMYNQVGPDASTVNYR